MGISFSPKSIDYLDQYRFNNKRVRSKDSKVHCTLKKVYKSSPLELRDLNVATRISALPGLLLFCCFYSCLFIFLHLIDFEQRLAALMNYVTSPETVRNSSLWLQRVTTQHGVGKGKRSDRVGHGVPL